MTTLVKALNQVNAYTPVDTQKIKTKVEQDVIKSIKVTGESKNLFKVQDLYKEMSSTKFEEDYNKTIIELIQQEFPQCQSKEDFSKLFDPGESSIQLTKGWGGVSAADMPAALDNLIVNIKKLLKIAFPTLSQLENYTKLQQATGEEFFNQLGKAFETMPNLFGDQSGHNVKQFITLCNSLEEAYPGLIQESGVDEKAFKKLIGNLPSLIGSALWENIAAIARQQVLEVCFEEIIRPIKENFEASGATVSSTYTQTGTEKNAQGQSEIADSLVTLSLKDDKGRVILEVTVADSTKFSQAKSGYFVKATDYEATLTLQQWLSKIRRKTYWSKRMGPYLMEPRDGTVRASWRAADAEAWNNTREAIYLKSAYDTLAVRASKGGTGQAATTFSLNSQIVTIAKFIAKYAEVAKGSGYVKNINSLAGGYENYVTNQLADSSGGSDTDEAKLKARYQSYISTILNTQIRISMNIFRGF